MTILKNGKEISREEQPKIKCNACGHRGVMDDFYGDDPDEDMCPACKVKDFEYV